MNSKGRVSPRWDHVCTWDHICIQQLKILAVLPMSTNDHEKAKGMAFWDYREFSEENSQRWDLWVMTFDCTFFFSLHISGNGEVSSKV